MSSHEITSRTALRNLIASLASWQAWTDEDASGAAARIAWPEYTALQFPFIVIVLLGGSRNNLLGSDSSANFRPRGGLGVIVVDRIADEADLMTSDTTFGTNFFRLIDDLIDASHASGLIIDQIGYGENPYTLSATNTSIPSDGDSDDEDDEATIEQKFWTGVFEIRTGGV